MFLANESHLKEVMLILFVSGELELLRKNNSNVLCFWWINDT